MTASLTLAEAWALQGAVGRLAGAGPVRGIVGQQRSALDVAARRASNEIGVARLAAMQAVEPAAPSGASHQGDAPGAPPCPQSVPGA